MKREMIHYPSRDLKISGPDLQTFTDRIQNSYRTGVPKAPCIVILDKHREKRTPFGKGVIEEHISEPTKLPIPAVHLEQPAITAPDPLPSHSASYRTRWYRHAHRDPPQQPRPCLLPPPSPCLKTQRGFERTYESTTPCGKLEHINCVGAEAF